MSQNDFSPFLQSTLTVPQTKKENRGGKTFKPPLLIFKERSGARLFWDHRRRLERGNDGNEGGYGGVRRVEAGMARERGSREETEEGC